MNCKRLIITVLNTIGPTSMPFNEFVLYRAQHLSDEEHCVVVLGPTDLSFIEQNKHQWEEINVKVVYCYASYLKLRRALNEVLANYKKQGRTPIVHLHHPRSGMAVQLLNLLFLRKVPTLLTIHNMIKLFAFPSRFMCYVNFLAADRISFVSHYAQSVFPGFLKMLRARCIYPIPNGVDIERVDRFIADSTAKSVPSDHSRTQNRFSLVNIGRLNKQKNQDWLIRLLTQLPEHVTLKIIGEGKLRGELESLAAELGVSQKMHLTGLLPREQVYRELINADLFVSPSLWEGLPIAVLEAMALRRPLVVSDIGPHREISRCGNSMKILPLEASLWVDQIKEFMEMDSSQRNDMGNENRRIIESNFTLDKMHEKYTHIYELLQASY
jgi:glycosyltransferase involved in cell wall biosynthesis